MKACSHFPTRERKSEKRVVNDSGRPLAHHPSKARGGVDFTRPYLEAKNMWAHAWLTARLKEHGYNYFRLAKWLKMGNANLRRLLKRHGVTRSTP